jgi:hypothetical protein
MVNAAVCRSLDLDSAGLILPRFVADQTLHRAVGGGDGIGEVERQLADAEGVEARAQGIELWRTGDGRS